MRLGIVQHYLAEDHARLDNLLHRAIDQQEKIDHQAYREFRMGLLRHIAMEEKVLFPTIQRLRSGSPLPLTDKLRLDHGALGTLIMPTPTRAIIESIRMILDSHNGLEEGSEGVYVQCEQIAGVEIEDLLRRLQAVSPVSVADYSDTPTVFGTIRRVLMRAGYPPKSMGPP
ncbi:MAG TPA: hemerythrin domain-containing protein [Nitrospirales bacterium]|nr:cation-binding protein [Nitrospiraceae bacterium]HNP30741.1 hemerythrin domain-containing protein [Nitrospirales bacterium]